MPRQNISSGVPWERLVSFGPSGFADYARVRFLPDPAYEGQSENDVDWNAVPCASDQWVALLELLSAHTRTANECYLCLWEGWPFPQSVLQGPKLTIPAPWHSRRLCRNRPRSASPCWRRNVFRVRWSGV